MGGSVYYDINNLLGDSVPKTDLRIFAKTADAIYKGIQKGEILAVHDISEGGALTCIFEMCVGGDMGVSLKLPKNKRDDYYLFNETAGTFIVEVESKEVAKKLFGK